MRPPANARLAQAAGLGLLALSAQALLLAPALMPAGYNWLRHTTSESAAQSVPGAWLARLGFLLANGAVFIPVAILALMVLSILAGYEHDAQKVQQVKP